MKTGHEYLNELPKDVQEKFLANLRTEENINEYLNRTNVNLYYFINDAFKWNNTKEGFDYWKNIAEGRTPLTIKSDWSIESYIQNKESDVITKDEAKLLIELVNKYYTKN